MIRTMTPAPPRSDMAATAQYSQPLAPARQGPPWHHVAQAFMPGTPRHCASDVSDAQWVQLAPYVVHTAKIGRAAIDARLVLNGILYVLTTGCAWRKMPAHYPNYVTCWRRLLRWQNAGAWSGVQRVLGATGYPLMTPNRPA